jgi:hypothetical protein
MEGGREGGMDVCVFLDQPYVLPPSQMVSVEERKMPLQNTKYFYKSYKIPMGNQSQPNNWGYFL